VRAVVHDTYGPPEVQRIEDVEKPVPNDDELLVRVHATTVTRTDTGFRSAEYFVSRFVTGLRRPRQRIGGMELAGDVVEVGPAVEAFAVGDRVFGVASRAHAEFVSVRESASIAPMPEGMTFEEAAAVADGALTALSGFSKLDVREGTRLLVYGATGSIGTAAVQLGRHFGAHVTAVSNTKNVELMKTLGADEVIDYLQEDFTKNGEAYDVVFDAVGKHSFRRSRHSLKPGGTYIATDPGVLWHLPLLALLTRWIGSRKAKLLLARYSKKDILLLKELIEAGEYRAVIDRRYPLEDVVEASRYVETGEKTGNVVLTVDDAGAAQTVRS
jgi:NADPH:quinone reductase-like Zn-dependent oxidoreductase